jgi:hypothetical protein
MDLSKCFPFGLVGLKHESFVRAVVWYWLTATISVFGVLITWTRHLYGNECNFRGVKRFGVSGIFFDTNNVVRVVVLI